MNVRDHSLVENWGPHVPYHASNGLVLRLDGETPVLEGGNTRHCLPTETSPDEAVRFLEQHLSQRILGTGPNLAASEGRTGPPQDILFRLAKGYITGDRLAEDILWRSQEIEFCCRWLLSSSNRGPNPTVRAATEDVLNLIEDGRLGLRQLEGFIERAAGLELKQCFFLHNVVASFEDMRGALLRASHHTASMVGFLWSVNNRESTIEFDTYLQPKSTEIKHSSQIGDRVGDEFTSALVSAYSALDLLFKMFVFLCREPFGDPTFPKSLHFSDIVGGKTWRTLERHKASDMSAMQGPMAIPFLAGTEFNALRKLRNELVHNRSADDIRPKIYLGVGTPRVRGLQLQYAQYRTRDVDSDGDPIAHPWCTRFYQQDRSADIELFGWLNKVWQTVTDTLDWLIQRLRVVATERGIKIPG